MDEEIEWEIGLASSLRVVLRLTGESFLQGDVDAVMREFVMNSVKGVSF